MIAVDSPRIPPAQLALLRAMSGKPAAQIGRASCRERV